MIRKRDVFAFLKRRVQWIRNALMECAYRCKKYKIRAQFSTPSSLRCSAFEVKQCI